MGRLVRSLTITATLSAALVRVPSVDNVLYAPAKGTMEYPGSGAGPDAAPTYVVKNKDTVDGIASRYACPNPEHRRPQQAAGALFAAARPDPAGARRKYVPAGNPRGRDRRLRRAPGGPPGAVKREALPPPSGATEQKTAAATGPAATGTPTPLAPVAAASPPPAPPPFQWPMRGKILTPYGTTADGQKSDGIDIAADNGAPVKAADGGKVAYVGDEVARLGNLVLIEHPGGYITAYGNNEAVLVKKGDVVKKGQTIARAGASGGAASPRVHFEVRRGGSKTIDPTTVLPAQ
jgi:murein DD-endopeptidase MepM/ murein hydrolase activator NlpD